MLQSIFKASVIFFCHCYVHLAVLGKTIYCNPIRRYDTDGETLVMFSLHLSLLHLHQSLEQGSI